MVSDWTWRFVKFPHCWGIKEFLWVYTPVLIFVWEVSIENMTSYRCDFECSFLPFEKITVDIDWARSCRSCLFGELVVRESLSNWQGNTWLLCDHHYIARILDVLCFWTKQAIFLWYLIVVIAAFDVFIHQEHLFIFLFVFVSLFNFQRFLLCSWCACFSDSIFDLLCFL